MLCQEIMQRRRLGEPCKYPSKFFIRGPKPLRGLRQFVCGYHARMFVPAAIETIAEFRERH